MEATDACFAEQDLVAQWLAEKCGGRQGDTNLWGRTTDSFKS
ncbi:putative DNA primase/helicase [Methylobacterium sp. 275MFSha3.1]|nr:putative DNA primase/helicase [Methylobacterium sp. 275MFSha3.1]